MMNRIENFIIGALLPAEIETIILAASLLPKKFTAYDLCLENPKYINKENRPYCNSKNNCFLRDDSGYCKSRVINRKFNLKSMSYKLNQATINSFK